MRREGRGRGRLIARLFVLLLLLGAVCAFFYLQLEKLSFQVPDVMSTYVESRLEAVSDLITYQYTYKNTVVQEDTRTVPFVGWEIPGTTHRLYVTYSGVIKAGFDLSEATTEVDHEKRIITIGLPEPRVTDNYIDEENLSFEGENNILNPIQGDELLRGLEERKQEALTQAKEDGLYEKATAEARKIISAWLSGIEGYQVEFS